MRAAAVRAMLLVGGVYLLAGIVFGALAGQAASTQGRTAWRLVAWLVSAVAFGAHIVYEQARIRSSTRTTALRVALASAIGAFGLAAAANIRALSVPRPHSLLLLLSLAIWPVMTALPAFVVALVAAIVLARIRPSV